MDRRFAGRTSCQWRAIFFSSLQGCTRHALPSPSNSQCHHQQPYQLLLSGRILAKQANPVDRSAVRLKSGGAEKRTSAIAVQTFKTLFSAAP
jgi:hypothetical protein